MRFFFPARQSPSVCYARGMALVNVLAPPTVICSSSKLRRRTMRGRGSRLIFTAEENDRLKGASSAGPDGLVSGRCLLRHACCNYGDNFGEDTEGAGYPRGRRNIPPLLPRERGPMASPVAIVGLRMKCLAY